MFYSKDALFKEADKQNASVLSTDSANEIIEKKFSSKRNSSGRGTRTSGRGESVAICTTRRQRATLSTGGRDGGSGGRESDRRPDVREGEMEDGSNESNRDAKYVDEMEIEDENDKDAEYIDECERGRGGGRCGRGGRGGRGATQEEQESPRAASI